MSKTRVAFVTTHPIQYQVPIFRILAQRADWDFHVLFCQIPDARMQGAEFNVEFKWDLPLLEGYSYRVLKNVSRRPSLMEFNGCDTPEIGEVLRALECDVVIVNGWVVKSCLQALRAARRQRIPCIVRGEANDLRRRARWKRWLQARLVNRYAACLAIGKASREFYRRRGVPDERIFMSPYCVDNRMFAEAGTAERSLTARTRWKIPENQVCYLYSGKFIEKKHPIELVRAFGSSAARERSHLLMVGDGPQRAECEAIAEKLQLPVTFTGFLNQSEILGAYAAADCLVLPSDAGETWGLVVNEAMAAGKPAIVSDLVGCWLDLVTPDETGAVFSFGDWNGLSRALAQCSEDREKLLRWGRAARDRVANYTPEAAAAGMVQGVEYARKKQ